MFAAQSVIWGVPYLFIKVAVDDGITPGFLAWARVILAALVLVPLAWRAGLLPSLGGRWRWLALFALSEFVIPFPLLGFGEQRIDSSIAAILIASTPIMISLLAIRVDPSETATGWRAVGLGIGFAGVVALLGVDVAGSGEELLGALAILGVALGYAIGPMIVKRRFADLDPRATMGVSLAIGAVALSPLAAVGAPTEVPSGSALIAIAVLGLICTALAFVIWGALIAEIGPSRALVITYVNPLVAVAAGTIFLDERPGLGALAGLVLILTGSWLATKGANSVVEEERPGRVSPMMDSSQSARHQT
jgi:drug/metabolite transporter (DMT)-like permease